MTDPPSTGAPPARLSVLAERFRRRFERPAAFIVRAPGRVNLLGEHTDYNGFPVLPMAIDRRILVAGAARDDAVVALCNTGAPFPPCTYALAEDIPAHAPGHWANYSKAAAQGVLRFCAGRPQHGTVHRGADLLVDGDIPSGAGLSSSSALVVANALALLAANAVDLPYDVLAELLPGAERYVGTLSGGMDQATSLLARAGHALRIDFFPLRVRTVPLPRGYSVVVCHSLVRAEKAGAAKEGYNRRVIECRLGCCLLAHRLGIRPPQLLRFLGDLTRLFPERRLRDFLDAPLPLPDGALALEEIAAAAGSSAEQLRRECEIPASLAGRFAVSRRLRHVLSEAERVDEAERALRAGDAYGFGRLMDASHASCRDDYEISCPELEACVALAKEGGAVGARLTGAGFGGCAVSLVPDGAVAAFLRHMDRAFYAPRLGPDGRAAEHRFVFQPQAGASVVWL